ncbi:hypothetical protein K523DRAFT_21677 [Schizophyllum commune Tattone D]|nr:hypothetical protein K523DRAFT_21677 [Schizophyllum commune Tattone D]
MGAAASHLRGMPLAFRTLRILQTRERVPTIFPHPPPTLLRDDRGRVSGREWVHEAWEASRPHPHHPLALLRAVQVAVGASKKFLSRSFRLSSLYLSLLIVLRVLVPSSSSSISSLQKRQHHHSETGRSAGPAIRHSGTPTMRVPQPPPRHPRRPPVPPMHPSHTPLPLQHLEKAAGEALAHDP